MLAPQNLVFLARFRFIKSWTNWWKKSGDTTRFTNTACVYSIWACNCLSCLFPICCINSSWPKTRLVRLDTVDDIGVGSPLFRYFLNKVATFWLCFCYLPRRDNTVARWNFGSLRSCTSRHGLWCNHKSSLHS